MFNKILSKLDSAIYKAFDPPTQHCDGCGEEYPMYYLVHMGQFDGDFCKRCAILEGEEE